MIKDADRIEVIDMETNFSHTDTAATIVQGFKEVLHGKPERTDCPVQGTVLFKKGDKTRLQAGYYKDASACNFLVVDDGSGKKGYRLDHNTLTYLGLYFQELKKKHYAKPH
ncbi:MAG: hypothetical protein WDO16_12635 [Bacteroidota bacterium]